MANRALRPGLLAALLALIVGLCGCTPDVTDVNERVIITALGLDAAPDGGVVVSASFLTFLKFESSASQGSSGGIGSGSGATDGGSGGAVVKTESGATVADALERLDGAVPGEIFFGSTRTVVIGADLARSGQLLSAVQPLMRLARLPRNENLAVVGGTADDFLRTKTPAADTVSRHLRLLYRTARETDIAYADPRIWQLYDALVSDAAITVPFVESSQEGPEVVGQAVFAQGRLQTVVGQDDLPYLEAIDWKGPVTITLGAMPGQTRPFSVRFSNFHIGAVLADDAASARITIQGTGTVAAGPLRSQTGSAQAAFDRFVSQAIADRTLELLQKLYAQGIDILHLDEQVRARTGVRPPASDFKSIRFEIRPMITITPTARGH